MTIFKRIKMLEKEVQKLKEDIQILNAKVGDIPIQVEVVNDQNGRIDPLEKYNQALNELYSQDI